MFKRILQTHWLTYNKANIPQAQATCKKYILALEIDNKALYTYGKLIIWQSYKAFAFRLPGWKPHRGLP